MDETSLVEPAAAVAARMRTALADSAGDEPEQLDTVTWLLCADDPALFTTPLPPMSDLLEPAGLVRVGDLVATEGFDFPTWRVNKRVESIQDQYYLDLGRRRIRPGRQRRTSCPDTPATAVTPNGVLRCSRRAGVPAEDDLYRTSQAVQPQARTDIGRNQRCWCGSGRKYKQCHMRREELPLEQRAGWLYQKAIC